VCKSDSHPSIEFSDAPTNILQTSLTNPKVAYRENLKMPLKTDAT